MRLKLYRRNILLAWAWARRLGGVALAWAVTLGPARAVALWEGLSADQKRRAEQITSLFENGTLDLQYGYCAALGDGRGYTAGRAGFTTASDEVVTIVKAYTERKPGNVLAPYLPRLDDLAREGSESVKGLRGFPKAWAEAAKDPMFRGLQDQLLEVRFIKPALEHAKELDLHTALAKAVLIDTIIQHGDDEDEDGLPALIKRTDQRAGGSPASGVKEKDWLRVFLEVRRADLAHAYDSDTRDEWAQSLDRVLAFEALAKEGNYELAGPIKISTPEVTATIP